MSKRVLEYDPLTGITTTFEHHPETDTTVIGREQDDVNLILDANKALANNDDLTKKGIKKGFWLYGQIPNIIQEKWLNEHGVNVWDKNNWGKNGPVYRLLNSREYRYLKTTAKMHWG